MPDKTEETIDAHGYLHSGDVAEFDDNNRRDVPVPSGFMKITGRIKELIITAGGENVAPVLIENDMKSAMLAMSNCMVVGENRKYLVLLLSLKCNVHPETGEPTDDLALDALSVSKQIGSVADTVSQAIMDPLWKQYIGDCIAKANKKAISNAQCIQKWHVLAQDFSEVGGELTPTLKLKRNVVSVKYAMLINSLYNDDIL